MATRPAPLRSTRPDAPRHATVSRKNNSRIHKQHSTAYRAVRGTAKFVKAHPRLVARAAIGTALYSYSVHRSPILLRHMRMTKNQRRFERYYQGRNKVLTAKLHYDYFRMKHSSTGKFNRHIQRGYHGRFI